MIGLVLALLSVAGAVDPACTPDQRQGFNVSGVATPVFPGTNQAVNWTVTPQSPVSAIESVWICLGADCQPPLSPPASIPLQSQHVAVSLPYTLTPAPGYVFRLALKSGGAACTVDSAPFAVVQGNGNVCSIGDSLCYQGSWQVPCKAQGVGQQPNIWAFGFAQQCPGGCLQNGTQASCAPLSSGGAPAARSAT